MDQRRKLVTLAGKLTVLGTKLEDKRDTQKKLVRLGVPMIHRGCLRHCESFSGRRMNGTHWKGNTLRFAQNLWENETGSAGMIGYFFCRVGRKDLYFSPRWVTI